MTTQRAAVIGTGFIGPVHVEALRRAGVEVVGILGSSVEKSVRAAESLGLETGYPTLEELLSDRRVDVVHVASPNRLHHEHARAALEAGKHVICEKPLAMTSPQSAQLVEVARQSGRAAAVCYNIRYYPLCIEMAQRVRAGDLGELFHVGGSYVQDWLLYDTDFNWRVLAESGGPLRAVADIGTHWLDLVQHLVGRRVEAVCADLATVHPVRNRPLGEVETFQGKLGDTTPREAIEVETEDYGSILLRLQGGARGSMTVSQVTAGRKNCLRLELAGSKRACSWNSERPNELWIGHRDRPNECLIRDPALLGERARGLSGYPGGHNEGFPDTFKQLFRDIYRAIDRESYRDTPTFPTFEDGHHEVLLCEAVLRSHGERRWVEVDQIGQHVSAPLGERT